MFLAWCEDCNFTPFKFNALFVLLQSNIKHHCAGVVLLNYGSAHYMGGEINTFFCVLNLKRSYTYLNEDKHSH